MDCNPFHISIEAQPRSQTLAQDIYPLPPPLRVSGTHCKHTLLTHIILATLKNIVIAGKTPPRAAAAVCSSDPLNPEVHSTWNVTATWQQDGFCQQWSNPELDMNTGCCAEYRGCHQRCCMGCRAAYSCVKGKHTPRTPGCNDGRQTVSRVLLCCF